MPQTDTKTLQAEMVRLRRTIKALEDQDRASRRDLEVARKLRKAKVAAPKWAPQKPIILKATVLEPLLLTSDFQCGEVIRPSEIEGLNAYNKDIFAERYQRLIERTVDVSDHHTGRAEFPGIRYLRMGDVVSGEIHEDLAETNDLSAVGAVRQVFQYEREGIKALRARFGRVKVISVNGNHDRLTRKPRTKNETGLSVGTLLSWWLESAFENDPRVTFQTSGSPDVMFPVGKWRVLMSHGDRMGAKGGGGFIGPEATIVRGHHQLYKNWCDGGQRPDVILTAHLHTAMMTQRGFGNGSLAGYSQFARDIRVIPDCASQWLLFIHEERKVAQSFKLQLSAMPKRHLLGERA